ncbi:MAG: DUF669 domain-containing protein [Christensenellales bacterium]
MSFTVNHSQASQGRFVAAEGIYECLIKGAKRAETRGGTAYLQLELFIREDIAQQSQGEVIEWPVWRKKEPGRSDPEGFPIGTIQHISRIAGFENGQEFPTLDAWLLALTGRPIRVEIKHEEYNGSTQARVWKVYESQKPAVQAGFVAVDPGEEMPF